MSSVLARRRCSSAPRSPRASASCETNKRRHTTARAETANGKREAQGNLQLEHSRTPAAEASLQLHLLPTRQRAHEQALPGVHSQLIHPRLERPRHPRSPPALQLRLAPATHRAHQQLPAATHHLLITQLIILQQASHSEEQGGKQQPRSTLDWKVFDTQVRKPIVSCFSCQRRSVLDSSCVARECICS